MHNKYTVTASHPDWVEVTESHPDWVDERDLADEDWVQDRWGK